MPLLFLGSIAGDPATST